MMPALSSRNWRTMHDHLREQARKHTDVEVLVELDEGGLPSGWKRHKLLRASRGRYVAFVDDDDRVSDNYVDTLRELTLAQTCDVATFALRFTRPPRAVPRRPPIPGVSEVWQFGLHSDERKDGRMSANHLCAWRRELAIRVAWCPELGNADDQLWYQPLLRSGLANTEAHTDQVLYHYLFDDVVTSNQRQSRVLRSRQYVGEGLRCFWYGEEIVIEIGDKPFVADPDEFALVRDSANALRLLPLADLRLFHTIRIK
jgi:hypothetical protein